MMNSLQDKGVLLPEQGKEGQSYNNHNQVSILEIRWIKGYIKRLVRGGKNTQKNYAKKVLMTQIIMMV